MEVLQVLEGVDGDISDLVETQVPETKTDSRQSALSRSKKFSKIFAR